MRQLFVLLCVLFFFSACNDRSPLLEDRYLGVSADMGESFENQPVHHTSPFGHVSNLDGDWQVAEGSMDKIPETFPARVTVPGLLSTALPAFDSVGIPCTRRAAFWYRRFFDLAPPRKNENVYLKIHKAKYGTQVWINGKEAGINTLNFSPTVLSITSLINTDKGSNEILVRVGAHIDQLPDTVTTGGEVEKFKYIPGIYDRVEIVVVPKVTIEEVQIAANPNNDSVKIGWVYNNLSMKRASANLRIRIYKYGKGDLMAEKEMGKVQLEGKKKLKHLETFVLPGLDPWTPEDPCLYVLQVSDGAYSFHTRFAARTFELDPNFTNRALLNDKPYFFRGTNVSLFRFFEDPLCKGQPWDKQWVRKLHRKMKSLGMNSYRISISALPDFWFDIADEEGVAIFAEFPMWYALKEGVSLADFEEERKHPQRKYGIYPEALTTSRLMREYSSWMQELWNHASVIAWDAQNETWTHASGAAINIVRHHDLSNRPWDNGWSPPAGPNDFREGHQYFARYKVGSEAKNAFAVVEKPFSLSDLPFKEKIPHTLYLPYQYAYGETLNDFTETPCILNEYGYLWLNRDGSPTTLTKPYYDAVLGPDATPDTRRYHYARMLAALTEYWRSARTCFGVLHAFMLGQSIPNGATSDNLLNVDDLELDPYFEEYVKDAFSPVGICIEYWEQPLAKSAKYDVPIMVTNDTERKQSGKLHLLLSDQEKVLIEKSVNYEVGAYLQNRQYIRIEVPQLPGSYRLSVTLETADFDDVRSLRKLTVRE